MGKIKHAVFDAGPLIHLNEIKHHKLLSLFTYVLITPQVYEECKNIQKTLNKNKSIITKKLLPSSKDFAKYLIERYDIDLGESTAIALCKQEKITLFFTDDLEARETANTLGFEPHGTIAIILRAYRENLLTKTETRQAIEALYEQSTLFFTKDLRDWTLREIENFSSR
jgi:predicted nucleic acid-binding protein